MTPDKLGVSMEAGNVFSSLDVIPPVGAVTMGRNGREQVWKWDNTSTNYGHWHFEYRTEAINNNRSPFMLDSNDGLLTGFTLGFYFKGDFGARDKLGHSLYVHSYHAGDRQKL